MIRAPALAIAATPVIQASSSTRVAVADDNLAIGGDHDGQIDVHRLQALAYQVAGSA